MLLCAVKMRFSSRDKSLEGVRLSKPEEKIVQFSKTKCQSGPKKVSCVRFHSNQAKHNGSI